MKLNQKQNEHRVSCVSSGFLVSFDNSLFPFVFRYVFESKSTTIRFMYIPRSLPLDFLYSVGGSSFECCGLSLCFSISLRTSSLLIVLVFDGAIFFVYFSTGTKRGVGQRNAKICKSS